MRIGQIMCVIPIAILTACGKAAPDCSASETQALVKQIVIEQFNQNLGAKRLGIDFNAGVFALGAIRMQGHDPKTGKYDCAAELKFTPNEPILGKSELKWAISYTSELTSKSGEFFVTVRIEE